jgi:hypothetical protein
MRQLWSGSYDASNVPTGFTMVVDSQPITDQVVTNLTIIRPSWSSKVVQIIIRIRTKDPSGKPTEILRIEQVALRQ